MRVSVIVPARNSAATLGRTLAALSAQEGAEPFEVIVVDNGSTDATGDIAERAGGPVTVIRQDNLGPAAGRNRGAAAARGEVLAFTDADCFPTRRWLSEGLRATAGADLVQGAVYPDPSTPMGPFDRSVWVVEEIGLYETANLFTSRALFDRLGGFEGWLAGTADRPFGEDLWFGWRARRAGARTAFAPAALVHHAVFPRSVRSYVAERFRNRHFAAAARLVPELRRQMFFARVFLNTRTAAFDLALLGAASAAKSRSPLLLLACAPYAVTAGRAALRWRRRAPAVAVAGMAADAAGLAGLLAGSIRWRSPVL